MRAPLASRVSATLLFFFFPPFFLTGLGGAPVVRAGTVPDSGDMSQGEGGRSCYSGASSFLGFFYGDPLEARGGDESAYNSLRGAP